MFIGARCALLHLLRHATYTHAIHIAASSSAWASPSQTAPPPILTQVSYPAYRRPRTAHIRVQLAL
ncbi:hypothetical protein FIBSPDRAFT_848928, partial [Athelia psychrophila]